MSNFHQFKNGSLLNKRPPDIEPKLWDLFLSDMNMAESLQRLPYPVQVDIELNSGCNMKCPFCIHGYTSIKNQTMGIDTYKKIIDEAVTLGVKSAKLSYINEPMMRTDLEKLIKYAKSVGILNTYIATNGTMLNKSRRHSLIKSGVTKVFVSIDAATPETYNKQRLNGKFELVVKNICALVSERDAMGLEFPIVRVSFLKNTLNSHEVEEFEDFWTKRADMIAFQKMNEVPGENTGLTIPDNDPPISGCHFPFKQLVVGTNGDIFPCCKLQGKKLKIGNIRHLSLHEAWNSQSMRNLKRAHIDRSWKDNDICRKCMMGCG